METEWLNLWMSVFKPPGGGFFVGTDLTSVESDTVSGPLPPIKTKGEFTGSRLLFISS